MKPSLLFAAALLLVQLAPSTAAPQTFAPGFSEHSVTAGGRTIYYRIGGSGPAVVLLHGFGDTGQMWAPLAPRLAVNHTVIVPDLPGLGLSRPESELARYDMASVARSMHTFMLQLGIHHAAVVGHDIGLMVAYAYAAQFPREVSKLALIDAPIPGVGPWVKVLLIQDTPQFHLFGPYAEQLVAGHERLYLDHIWDVNAYHPSRVTDATRAFYARSYAQPRNMHAAMSYFKGFYQDADDNIVFAKTPLTMPVLAMGGEKSLGPLMPGFAKAVATNVQVSLIPDSGHWVMDENPSATMEVLIRFLSSS
jgi:pimeloyl-ACP methyl ester carboxylesterase